MYTQRNYGFLMTFRWSSKPFLYGSLYAIPFTALQFLGIADISLPWQPISVLGIAVAFYLGFKNNSSYDRTWEARKIWGGIVNSSRSLGTAWISFIKTENEQVKKELMKELVYRHIAWLTALRYQLRLGRKWEHASERVKGLYMPEICEEYYERIEDELKPYLTQEEIRSYRGLGNMALHMLSVQSRRMQELRDMNLMDDFRHMQVQSLIQELISDQGRSERIKNFPFPRQYASTALWTTWVFCALLPFGLLNHFTGMKEMAVWLTVPFSGLTTWIFFLMEKIGDYSENPFEGSYNDVPITAISRGIEIDLREMIGDSGIPKPVEEKNGFLM